MLWIVQEDIHKEYGYSRFIETLERFSLPHVIVKYIPFACDLQFPEEFDKQLLTGPVIVMGSYGVSRAAAAAGWKPGSFLGNDPDSFDYTTAIKNYGDMMLNPDAQVGAISTIEPPDNLFFLKPVKDDKSFAGKVFASWELREWQGYLKTLDDPTAQLHKDTQVLISTVKEIYAEYRFFVIDGKIIAKSRYKLGRQVLYNEDVPVMVEFFATCAINRWMPDDRGFVIDIAETPDGPKIIEVQNMNSAGFYSCDVQKIVVAVEDLARTRGWNG